MQITAKEIQASAYARIDAMINHGKSPTSTYRELAKLSGLSQSRIRMFHHRLHPRLSTDTLDDLVSAITSLERIEAAA
jgi:hypothetical protein